MQVAQDLPIFVIILRVSEQSQIKEQENSISSEQSSLQSKDSVKKTICFPEFHT